MIVTINNEIYENINRNSGYIKNIIEFVNDDTDEININIGIRNLKKDDGHKLVNDIKPNNSELVDNNGELNNNKLVDNNGELNNNKLVDNNKKLNNELVSDIKPNNNELIKNKKLNNKLIDDNKPNNNELADDIKKLSNNELVNDIKPNNNELINNKKLNNELDKISNKKLNKSTINIEMFDLSHNELLTINKISKKCKNVKKIDNNMEICVILNMNNCYKYLKEKMEKKQAIILLDEYMKIFKKLLESKPIDKLIEMVYFCRYFDLIKVENVLYIYLSEFINELSMYNSIELFKKYSKKSFKESKIRENINEWKWYLKLDDINYDENNDIFSNVNKN
jgi:hypothetical protein